MSSFRLTSSTTSSERRNRDIRISPPTLVFSTTTEIPGAIQLRNRSDSQVRDHLEGMSSSTVPSQGSDGSEPRPSGNFARSFRHQAHAIRSRLRDAVPFRHGSGEIPGRQQDSARRPATRPPTTPSSHIQQPSPSAHAPTPAISRDDRWVYTGQPRQRMPANYGWPRPPSPPSSSRTFRTVSGDITDQVRQPGTMYARHADQMDLLSEERIDALLEEHAHLREHLHPDRLGLHNDETPVTWQGASQAVVTRLPTRSTTEADKNEDGEATCAICTCKVPMGEDVTVLPCEHWFHGECVKPWLQTNGTCPLCRVAVTSRA